MIHKTIVRIDESMPHRPYFASCSCGPQGNFVEKAQAVEFLSNHSATLAAGLNTVEFADETEPKPAAEPEEPGAAKPAEGEPAEAPEAEESEEVKKNGEEGEKAASRGAGT